MNKYMNNEQTNKWWTNNDKQTIKEQWINDDKLPNDYQPNYEWTKNEQRMTKCGEWCGSGLWLALGVHERSG